jgi:hypothetical protein
MGIKLMSHEAGGNLGLVRDGTSNVTGVRLYNEPYNEALGEDHSTSLKGSYQHHRKPIWFHAREIDYRGDILDKATYGEM